VARERAYAVADESDVAVELVPQGVSSEHLTVLHDPSE
jgi:hypothetical protein